MPSQQGPAWLQTLATLLPQPVPWPVALGGSPGVCRWAGLDGGDGPGARDRFLSTQQQGGWQEPLSDASGAQRTPQGDNMGCRDPES